MALHRAAAQWRLGQLRAGKGNALSMESEKWMAENGVRDPGRMLRVIAPGWPASAMHSGTE
jgi:hypothetical protein